MAGASLIDQFAALEDPRQRWKVQFPLPEVLMVVLCGTLAGAEDFVEIRRTLMIPPPLSTAASRRPDGDHGRQRPGAGPQNVAIVRHMTMNLLPGPKDKHSLKVSD